MNIDYRKIFNKNYMILSDYNIADYKECYRSKMLKNNPLDHFLIYDTQNINGKIQFTYDISSKQSIYTFYENCEIDYETIRHIIMSLKAAFDTLNQYLLEPDYMILDPSLIFMNIATKAIYVCYCPGEKHNFYESLNELLCYILTKINHNDNNSIILAYSLQQQSMNTNYTLDNLIEILNKNNILHPQEPQIVFEEDNNTPGISPDLSSFTNNNIINQIPEHKKCLPYIVYAGFILITSALLFFSYFVLNFLSTELSVVIGIILLLIYYNIYQFLKRYNHQSECESMEIPSNDSENDTLSEEDIQTESNYYEDTVILGFRSSAKLPRLIYTGTDFTSEIEISCFPFLIGKMEENVNMVIDNPMISRIHAKIYFKENTYYIEDMNSSNGTYINNNLIQPHTLTEITAGDYITFSHLTYIFQ